MCDDCEAQEQAEIEYLIAQREQENEDYAFHEHRRRQNVIGRYGD